MNRDMAELEPVIRHYEGCLKQHGISPQGVDWRDREGQRLRFRVLCDILPLDGCSLLDVGCGLGDLYDYLHSIGWSGTYEGCDLSGAMIAEARRLHPGLPFHTHNLLTGEGESLDQQEYDVIVACGTLLVKAEISVSAWQELVNAMITRMFGMSRRGVALNLLSPFVDFRRPDLFYSDPQNTIRICRQLTRFFALRHDYPLYEYMVYLYHHSPWEVP